jgi:acyl-CoA reductase-like NAD-dependent aldehyde dehydrogenase
MPTKTIDVIAKIIRGDYVIKPVVCEPPAYLDQAIQDARAALAKAEDERRDWRNKIQQQRQQSARLTTQCFRADLEAEFGMAGHPKAGKIWDKAWEDGHSYGLVEVVNTYAELVDLLK